MGKTTLQNLKILFCPHEIGGQMQLMVEELRRRGLYATAASYTQEWFGHVNDIQLDLRQRRGRLGRHVSVLMFTLWAAQNYDIFHFFWGRSLYGMGCFPHLDLPLLRRMGKKVFVHFRGSDIRDLAYFDYLHARAMGQEVAEPPLSRPDQQRSLRSWRRYAHRMFVSSPDLLRLVPEAELVQQAIDLDHWRPERPHPGSHEDGIIRIMHAPSRRSTKGTDCIERSVSELRKEGYPVELVLIEKIPFHRIKETYERCDIGIDQVLCGWYGKVSIEFMALRRPVICYIDENLQSLRPDLPLVNAAPRNLTEKLRELVVDAELRRRLGDQGYEYVRQHHDVKAIVDQCLELYARSL